MNQNFQDIIDALTNGTKDISVSAITAAGNVSFQGNTTLGDASSDDVTWNASLASTIPIKTTNTYAIGSSTKGLASLYLANSTFTAQLISGSLSANVVFTFPTITDTILGVSATQNVANKTLNNTNSVTVKDSAFAVQDNSDATKQLLFECSGITTGNNRTLTVPDASGTILLQENVATQSDQETSTSTTTFVSPGRQQYHPSASKAWVKFTSVTTTAISVSYNITSLTDNGTGVTTVTIATDFSSANYCTVTASNSNTSAAGCLCLVGDGSVKAAGSCQFYTITPSTLALADAADINVAMFGDQ